MTSSSAISSGVGLNFMRTLGYDVAHWVPIILPLAKLSAQGLANHSPENKYA
jgi:hypothetical protein